jgi:Flp pilus assembly protein TadG
MDPDTGREQPVMRHRTARNTPRDRGAAAVEFALLLPLLLLLVFGIIDFGRALNAQITLTQAAREGVRLDAVGQSTANVVTRTQAAATGLNPVGVTVTACPVNAGAGVNATVKATYTFSFLTPLASISHMFGASFGAPITLTATGVMPCET